MRVATAAVVLAPIFATSLAGAEEQLPAPSLVLTVMPGAGGAPWTMKVANVGALPVRVIADPRLLSLEVAPPAGYIPADQWKSTKPRSSTDAKPVKCALPDDVRPRVEAGPDLVIPGGRSWSTSFDPLYYCFGVKERNLLVAGATVTPRFGFAPPKAGKGATTAPFVASPVGAAVGQVTAAKEIVGASVTLAEAALTMLPPLAGATGASSTGTLEISIPETMDVGRGVELGTTVTLANVSDRAQTFLFRHSTLGFTVQGPSGSVACGQRRVVDGPIKELFTTLGPKGRTSIGLLVDAVCPPDTFDNPGVYRVVPRLDTTNASGRSIGLRTFEGVVEGNRPLLLRVRAPRRPGIAARPALD